MKIAEAMTKEVATVSKDASVADVAKLLMEHTCSGIPVVDEQGKLLGLVTETDLFPKLKKVPFARARLPALFGDWINDENFDELITSAKTNRVSDIMTSSLITVGPDDALSKAAELMTVHEVTSLPVVSEGALVGIIARSDILRSFAAE